MLNDEKLLKVKAVFQICILVFAMFSISLLGAKEVSAEEQNVCCAETNGGEHCVYTASSNCKQGALQAAANCEQTSFCKLGCGYDQVEGMCFNNMPKFSCEEQEDCAWSEGAGCDVPQCQKGCCVLSNQCSFITQLQCKQVTSHYEDINMTFMEEIGSELDCINQCRSFERGACVHADASCDFVTRDSCDEVTPSVTNRTLPLVGFHSGKLCSNADLGTECAPQHTTGCLADADEVYWFDSCGNPENIYDSDKRASWNNGYVLSKAESCDFAEPNVGDENCGNCNYAFGSLCAEAEKGVSPVYGDYACKDLSCDADTVNIGVNAPATANLPLENGESWCAYDGLVGLSENAGMGLDKVGSRHYRRICINGVELTEPCRDFREELCIQGTVDPSQDPALQNIFGTQKSFALGGGAEGNLIYGACRNNRFSDCTNMAKKKDCENVAARDCLWIGGEGKVDDGIIKCVPLVSPGLKHWSGKSTTATNNLDPKATCEKGNTECVVHFYKAGIGWFDKGAPWRGKGDSGNENPGGEGRDWECVANCECLELDYLKSANSVCRSLGDCGAWYNIAGVETCEGFVDNLGKGIESIHRDITVCGNLINIGHLDAKKGKGADTGFGAFFERSWIPLSWLALSGTIAMLSQGVFFATGGLSAFSSGFFGGFSAIPYFTPWGTSYYTGTTASIFGEGVFKSVPSESFTKDVVYSKFTGEPSSVVTDPSKVTPNHHSYIVKSVYDPTKLNTFVTEGMKDGLTFSTDGISAEALELLETNNVIAHQGGGFAQFGTEKAATDGWANIVGDKTKNEIVENGFKEVGADGIKTFDGVSPGGYAANYFMQIVSLVMTIYTIYQLLDTFLSDTKTETITITCNTWQAPVGGECGKCQQKGKECSEYRCKSLGQMCDLINVGTEDEKCISTHPNDAVPPFVAVDKETIIHYTDSVDNPNDIVEVRGKGFEIDKKIAPFTAVTLAITTNEYAQCKYDIDHDLPYEEMAQYFGDSIYAKEHKLTFSMPGILAEDEILKITNGGEYQIFVKCQDGNGNQNEAGYYAKFAIDDGPDFTPPVIELTSLPNGGYVSAGVNATPLFMYVNEPANCKWDDIDAEFKNMFNDFICSKNPFPTTSLYYGLYECSTILTGIEDGKEKTFFFRCEDQPSVPEEERNVNMESYVFRLKGTIPLEITSVYPDEGVELKFNSPVLKIVTEKGAFGNGVSYCGYNFDDPNPMNTIDFLNTNNSVHEQPFYNLTAGEYGVYVNCIDIAGNTANETAEFTIVVDTYPPQLMNFYTEPNLLHIKMDEPCTCEYSVEGSFGYGSGIPMTGTNTEDHTASLEGSTFWIMCQDVFENIGSYIIYV